MPSWIQRAMMSSLRPERLWETPRAQRPCSFHDLRHPSGIAWAQWFDPGCATETAGFMKTASSA